MFRSYVIYFIASRPRIFSARYKVISNTWEFFLKVFESQSFLLDDFTPLSSPWQHDVSRKTNFLISASVSLFPSVESLSEEGERLQAPNESLICDKTRRKAYRVLFVSCLFLSIDSRKQNCQTNAWLDLSEEIFFFLAGYRIEKRGSPRVVNGFTGRYSRM